MDHNALKRNGIVRLFCGFPMIEDCYQNHGFLSPTHVLVTPLIHAFTTSEQFCMVFIPCFEFLFRSSIVKKLLLDAVDVAVYIRHWVRPSQLNRSLVLICKIFCFCHLFNLGAWNYVLLMMFSMLVAQQ